MKYFIIFFIYLSTFFNGFNCVVPPIDQYNCLLSFVSKYNITSLYSKLNATHYDFCLSFDCDSVTGFVNGFVVSNTASSGYNGSPIFPSDLQCCPYFIRISLNGFNVSKELIYNKFPQKVNDITYTFGNNQCYPIDQQLPDCLSFYYTCIFLSGTTIKMSYIQNISIFSLSGSYPYFDNDIIVNNSPLFLFQSYSNNFPNVSNFPNLIDFRITFDENFYLPSISNFSSIRSKTISITHNYNYLFPFYIDSNPYFSEISIFAKFEKPNSFFNLSSHGYKKMSLGNVGDQFNINGEIPIIPSPNSYHLINYGDFTTFPNLSLFNGEISISVSNLPVTLPVYIGKNQNIILANNRLKGTIDESWCNSLLIIRNNTLSGEIPSCFTCYFSDPLVFNFFSGNQFSNYNKSIGCPNFAPRFELLKNSSQQNFFRVTGTNIGYYPNYWLLNSNGYLYNYDVISMGYEYIVRFTPSYPSNPKYFNITFQHPQPSQTITYPVNKSLPTPSSLQITSNIYLFTGQFFSSYMGYTNQSVVIGGSNNCSIKNTTFFNMTCEFDSSTSSLSYPTIVDITNDNLLRRVIINPQIGNLNQVKCPNDCDDLNGSICDLTQGICFFLNCTYDCGAFGTCNNRTGVCDCNYNHQGQNCSLPFVQCPIGSNSIICSGDDNHCNNQTGVCVCDANHQGQSCSVPLKKCPIGLNSLVCSGGTNYCNNQTGICSCDSNLQGLDCSLPYKQCPIGVNSLVCSGDFNSCNNQTGLCKCDQNHQGNDCSIPFKQCPLGMDSLICSGGLNSCNNQTGVCNCEPNFQGSDCSIPFKQCPVGLDSLICSGGSSHCNNQTGACTCDFKYTTNDCSKPNQYISSVLPSNTTGGEASFNGWFGDIHSNLYLLIGNKQCSPITFNSSNEIKCIAPPGKGVYNIFINQNEIEYQLKDGYSYIELIGTCPNNCTNSNQGVCNTSNSQCSCINDYYSFDCSLKKNNNGGGGGNTGNNSTVDPSTGVTNITDSQVNFQIYFKNLFEIDFNGNIINKYSLKSNWTFNKTKDNQTNNIYKLEQTIQQSCQIISTIEEVSTSKEFSFAGSTFTLDAGSIKLTISISNYTYKSNLNTLQLQLISSVDDQNEESNCNTKESSTNEISSSSFKYIKISKDNRVLQGRFINKVLSDGRSTYLSTDIKSDGNTVIATLNLPHFVNQSIIDPDFSVLLDTDFKSECNSENNRKWLIPVAVIVPVVGVSCIGGIIYLIYIKKAIEIPLKLKLKKLSK
ncbi:hypothetical protein RB653_010127 [Dictyostelium firmibasis]|uniref:EGF-like domain-containing protein n=1 Tax=Dictyostelium firmibasis TaxID=79012 RepID=A0AAN7TTA0_9MYCE